MQTKLDDILCGVQHVPTLLLHDPQQPLLQLDLDQYTVIDYKPLHDLKGHFSYLLDKLPCCCHELIGLQDIIRATTSNTMTGDKYRVCMIEVYLYLLHQRNSSCLWKLLFRHLSCCIWMKLNAIHTTSFASTTVSGFTTSSATSCSSSTR